MRRFGGLAILLLCLHQAGSSEPTIVYRGSGGGGIEAGQGVKLESFDPARGFWSVTLAESGEDGGSVDFKMLDVDVGEVRFFWGGVGGSHHFTVCFLPSLIDIQPQLSVNVSISTGIFSDLPAHPRCRTKPILRASPLPSRAARC